jgi:hypothetical protein
MAARRIGAALFGAAAGAWLSRALFKWILGFDGTLLTALVVGSALVGAAVCVAGEIESESRGS